MLDEESVEGMNWIFWLIVGAAVVHVAEEYWAGWVEWVGQIVPGVTMAQFAVVNLLFLLLCVGAAIAPSGSVILRLSVASLLFVNVPFHLVPAIAMRAYSPGLVSALLLYVPLAAYAWYLYVRSGLLTMANTVAAALLGLLWMGLPLAFQAMRMHIGRR